MSDGLCEGALRPGAGQTPCGAPAEVGAAGDARCAACYALEAATAVLAARESLALAEAHLAAATAAAGQVPAAVLGGVAHLIALDVTPRFVLVRAVNGYGVYDRLLARPLQGVVPTRRQAEARLAGENGEFSLRYWNGDLTRDEFDALARRGGQCPR